MVRNHTFAVLEALNQILHRYRDDARTRQLVQSWSAADSYAQYRLNGLVGSLECFVMAGAYLADPRPFLVVAKEKEEAAYLLTTLSNLLGEQRVRFLPDSFKRPRYFEALNTGQVLQRTETINRIANNTTTTEIVVTYPEALFEQVVDPRVLADARLQLKAGERTDVDTLIEVLVEYGFKREDFVYEPGQFSVRGGIIDVFSYGNEYPYRIELFDDEIESIRTFHPTTQLSQQNIALINLVPNINTKFSRQEKVPFFSVLPENAVCWVKDMQFVMDQLQTCFEEAEKFTRRLSALDQSELAEILRDRAFVYPADVLAALRERHLVVLTQRPQPLELGQQLVYQASPQPSFNKNFNLLIEDLRAQLKAGRENYLFTDNPKQVERFYAIFEDLEANVQFQPIVKSIHEGFIDKDLKLVCYTDHQIFERFHRYKLKRGFTKDQAINLRMLRELQPGDFVTHIDHGVGRYSGLEKIDINGNVQESVRLVYKNNDLLYVSINSLHKISKFVGKDGQPPKLDKIGSDAWKKLKSRTKRKVKDIAGELIKLYAKRKATPGHAFGPDDYMQNELEASFIYEDTPDQLQATNDVKADMMADNPMDRLICGDVGFGKTEVALRGAFKAVVGGKQVAILVPTTILALQHYQTFQERLKEFGVTVDYVNRFRTTKEKTQIFKDLAEGKIDIVIGTHAILNKKVKFKDLGLLVIDEEQKFGVAAKEKLRNLKVNVDTLTLTATPIPRTLQFSLMAARDLSVIRTPPPNRQAIHTEVRTFNDELIKEAIYYEVNRGGQVFFVHNRVKSLPDITAMLRRLCPDIDIVSAHGQMESKDLEETLLSFIDRRYDVLVCTNIIETGLDIPNANTIIINNAHQFGMSDLHQLRGRVGRSNRKAFCYLFCPPVSTLTSEARKRLRTLEEFSDLGSGFNIAMKDLDIRGAGNMLGGEQSGFISDIGYETYQKILEEAIQELKQTEFRELFAKELEEKGTFVREVQIDVDAEMLLPDEYVTSIQERLSLYQAINKIETEEGIEKFRKKLRDRFGPVPPATETLFKGLRLRWICRRLGFERFLLKNGKMRCYFVENPQSPFYESATFQRVLQWVSQDGKKYGLSFKKNARYFFLVRDNVKSMEQAHRLLKLIQAGVMEVVE